MRYLTPFKSYTRYTRGTRGGWYDPPSFFVYSVLSFLPGRETNIPFFRGNVGLHLHTYMFVFWKPEVVKINNNTRNLCENGWIQPHNVKPIYMYGLYVWMHIYTYIKMCRYVFVYLGCIDQFQNTHNLIFVIQKVKNVRNYIKYR